MLLGLLHITSYIERKNNFFLSYPAITDTKSSPEGVRNNGSRLTPIKTFTYM